MAEAVATSSHETASDAPVPGTTHSKNVPWYTEELPKIPEETRKLLEEYSHIPPDEVEKHVIDIRERAWVVHPYPCIGGYRFLELSLSHNPAWPRILSLLKPPSPSASSSPPLLLDLGCCFGQDIRSLIRAGIPPSHLKGAELEAAFVDLGYELFRDKATLGVEFLTGDVLSDSSFSSLYGKVSIVHAAAFLHLWPWDGQVDVATRIVRLLRDEVGVMVVGRQVGSIKPHEKMHETNRSRGMYKHDPVTFERMWEEVGSKTGTKWEVRATLDEVGTGGMDGKGERGKWAGDPRWHNEDTRRLVWEVERVG